MTTSPVFAFTSIVVGLPLTGTFTRAVTVFVVPLISV